MWEMKLHSLFAALDTQTDIHVLHSAKHLQVDLCTFRCCLSGRDSRGCGWATLTEQMTGITWNSLCLDGISGDVQSDKSSAFARLHFQGSVAASNIELSCPNSPFWKLLVCVWVTSLMLRSFASIVHELELLLPLRRLRLTHERSAGRPIIICLAATEFPNPLLCFMNYWTDRC